MAGLTTFPGAPFPASDLPIHPKSHPVGKGELIPLRFPHPACFLVLALFNSLPSVKTLHLTGCAPAVHLLAGLFGTLNAFFHESSCRWRGPSPTEAQPLIFWPQGWAGGRRWNLGSSRGSIRGGSAQGVGGGIQGSLEAL